MIITAYITKYSKVFTIFPFLNGLTAKGDQCKIEIYQHDRTGEGFDKAEINWPACGTQKSDYVKEFTEGLQFALIVTEYLNEGKRIEVGKEGWCLTKDVKIMEA